MHKDQTIVLIHVRVRPPGLHSSHSLPPPRQMQSSDMTGDNSNMDQHTKRVFLPFRCFCTRNDIQCQDIILEDTDVVKALVEYVTQSAIEILVLGTASRNGFLRRLEATDIPGSVSKGVPDFCTVYCISKAKISSTRSATRMAPTVSPLRNQIMYQASIKSDRHIVTPRHHPSVSTKATPEKFLSEPTIPHNKHNDLDYIKSPFTHRKGPTGKFYLELSTPPDLDISFVSSGRLSIVCKLYEGSDISRSPPLSFYYSDSRYSASQPQGYAPPPHDQYGKAPPPSSYGGMPPHHGPPAAQTYGQPWGDVPYQGGGPSPSQQAYGQNPPPPQQQTYPYAAATGQAQHPQYGSQSATDAYNQQQIYPQQSGGQPVAVAGYGQQGPGGYAQQGTVAGGYGGSYPTMQQGYGGDQSIQNNAGGYTADPAAAAAYGGGPAYGSQPTGYAQQVPAQPGYDQSAPPAAGGYQKTTVSPQPGYPPQYDASAQMYGAPSR